MNFTEIAINLISNLGYLGLFFGLVIDSLGVPIPSEVLIPVATVLAIQGRYNLVAIFVIGVSAQVIGGIIAYAIGRYGGEPFLKKYGKYVLISQDDLDKTNRAFAKYGKALTLFGRCLPVIRGLIGYPAGIAEMPIRTYIIYCALGSAIWTAVLMGLGVVMQQNLELLDQLGKKFSVVIVILLVLAIAWHFRHLFKHQKGPAE